MNNLIAIVTGLIIAFIDKTGYLGIAALMTAESALIPIPSEVTMPFAGFMASVGRFNIYLVIIVGALANLLGSLIAYGVGYWGQEPVVRRLIQSYGKYVFISEAEFNRSERWFRKYGPKIVFFSRILPIVRTFISLPAGIAHMSFLSFTLFTLAGSLIWSALLTYIGFALGKNWHLIEIYYRRFEYLIIFLLLAFVIYFLYHKLHRHREK